MRDPIDDREGCRRRVVKLMTTLTLICLAPQAGLTGDYPDQ
jgi:hypothetical protein